MWFIRVVGWQAARSLITQFLRRVALHDLKETAPFAIYRVLASLSEVWSMTAIASTSIR